MRLFKKKTREQRRRNGIRRLVAYGTLSALLIGFYYYQPQRINFHVQHPKNPPLDPDSSRLFSKGVKIALIQAHPDDSEFFLAPLLLRLAKSGAEIHQLVMTDGDKSFYFWKKEDAAENRRVREHEQMEAASHYAKDVTFLHRPDGRLAYQADNAAQVQAFLNRVQPEYVICFDPDYWPRINHSDHLASGRATIDAIKDMNGKTSVKWILMFDTTGANFTPSVDDTVNEGIGMLAIHKSQFYGERLSRLKNMRLESWYDDGAAVGQGFGIALRAVRVR